MIISLSYIGIELFCVTLIFRTISLQTVGGRHALVTNRKKRIRSPYLPVQCDGQEVQIGRAKSRFLNTPDVFVAVFQ